MFKSFFWFVVGSGATLAFFAVMLFIFGQSDHLICLHTGDGLATCSVSHKLLEVVPVGGWTQANINNARVEQDCDTDGCTYRTDLRTSTGASRPVDEVWTDDESGDQDMADSINAFLSNSEAPALVVDTLPTLWVIWLLVGLAVMSVGIQAFVLVSNVVRAVFGQRSQMSRYG